MCNSTESHGLERSYTDRVVQRTSLTTTGPLTMETLAVGPVHKTGRKDQGFVMSCVGSDPGVSVSDAPDLVGRRLVHIIAGLHINIPPALWES